MGRLAAPEQAADARRSWPESVGIAVLAFAVYVAGACPTIYAGDSGDLVTAVHLLGIPHPTGYPLYVLLGKLWTLLVPFGSVAWRMSLFSAVCAAAACGVLYHLGRRARLQPAACAFAALLLAFSPSFWSQANIQRVYSLGALFVLLATLASFRWHERRSGRRLAVAFFVCGLGAANHSFMAVYAAALGAFTLAAEPSILRRPREIAAAGAAFAVGLLPYAYLPLRSRADPLLDWGNPETLQAFLDVVLRRDFWERRWLEAPRDLVTVAADWGSSLAVETAWIGAALAPIGLVAARRRGWPALLLVLVMLGNVGALALHGSRSDIFLWHRYYIPSYAMMALLAGVGCDALIQRLPRRARLLPLLIPAVLLATGWRSFDRSRFGISEAFANEVLRSLPPGAHLIATDDNILFALMYLHLAEGRRPDINLILQGVGDAALPPLRFEPETEPLFLVHHPSWNLPSLEIVPVGVVFRAWRSGAPPPPLVLPNGPLEGENDPRVPKDYLTQNLIGHFHYMLGVTLERRDWLAARREFEAAIAAAPQNDVLFYNLGLIFGRNGLLEDAIAAFERSHDINPRHIASRSRVRAADRLAEFAGEKERLTRVEAALTDDSTPPSLDPQTPAYHRWLAEQLEARQEPVAARGHRLRALELSRS